MCLSCGCQMPDVDHNDSRNITLLDLRSAAMWAGIDLYQAAMNLTRTVCGALNKGALGPATTGSTANLVVKASPESRYLLSVAYPAFKPDVAIAADGRVDVASAKVVEEACWNFARKGKIGLWHADGTEGAAQVVENYIYRADPWVTKAADGTAQVIMPGDWLVGMILDQPAWDLYKANKIGGVSVQGFAKRARPSSETIERVKERLNGGRS